MNLKKYLLKNKNNKFLYYVRALFREAMPGSWVRSALSSKLTKDWGAQWPYIKGRVDYYNKLEEKTLLSGDAIAINSYRIPKKIRVYYFDSMEYLRFFDPSLRFEIVPGDVVDVPRYPAIVKSRPISTTNSNAVILNLDKARHFNFVRDDIPFGAKRDMLVGRSGFSQPHRKRFFELYSDHPLCNLKKATKSSDPGFLSIEQHLAYKFVLALEGNDVATNLKWIMSSNSIAVMPRPRYETWFMEGTLNPDYHYVCIAEDYSDLEDKLRIFIANKDAAEAIVRNGNQYVDQFKHKKREDAISLIVPQKYFERTN